MTDLPYNEILCGRNEHVMTTFPPDSIDLTVTSPPYDNLRTYKGFEWDFNATARELWRVTKPGGVVVWVVADATVNGSETGTSFRQALAFMALGFNLHDTMIYEKDAFSFPSPVRYHQIFEYMFVFCKGSIKTVNLLKDRKNKYAGETIRGKYRDADGSLKEKSGHKVGRVLEDFGIRYNIWRFLNGKGKATLDDIYDHPGTFPEKLAEDHILSWSNPGDVVLDPFIGSGTTAKMAIKHHRRFIGIDISAEYCDMIRRRIAAVQPTLFDLTAA